jgi:hypothetical protein
MGHTDTKANNNGRDKLRDMHTGHDEWVWISESGWVL